MRVMDVVPLLYTGGSKELITACEVKKKPHRKTNLEKSQTEDLRFVTNVFI